MKFSFQFLFAATALLAMPATAVAQSVPVPTVAQCDAKKAEAVAWRKHVFNTRMTEAGKPWLAMGASMDEYLWAEEGVKALACYLAAKPATGASTGPAYKDGYSAGVAAAAARAASTPTP